MARIFEKNTPFVVKALAVASAIPFAVAYVALAIYWKTYVLAVVWNLFIPTLFSLRPLTHGSALALALVVGCFLHREYSRKKPKFRWMVLMDFVSPLVGLGIAKALHAAVLAGYVSF